MRTARHSFCASCGVFVEVDKDGRKILHFDMKKPWWPPKACPGTGAAPSDDESERGRAFGLSLVDKEVECARAAIDRARERLNRALDARRKLMEGV